MRMFSFCVLLLEMVINFITLFSAVLQKTRPKDNILTDELQAYIQVFYCIFNELPHRVQKLSFCNSKAFMNVSNS